jgi:hypothetical protein
MQWPTELTDPSYAPLVLGAVAEGRFEHTFVPLVVDAGGHRGIFAVSQDALRMDGVRIDVSAILQQHVADLLGAHLLTPKLFDQMWANRAVTLLPCTQPITSSAAGMVGHSACVDKRLAAAGGTPPNGIVQTVGKTWVLSNKLTDRVAMNMGWHLDQPLAGVPFDSAPTLPGAHMIQSPGTRHGPNHVDYSQIALFVKRECVVDGRSTTFDAVAGDPAFATLVSHEGVLRVLRQPGAPELVRPPTVMSKPVSGATVALAATGAGIGASLAGPLGALFGATLGWAADAIRRRLLA